MLIRRLMIVAVVILICVPAFAVSYTYDGAGRLTRVNYANGKVIVYRYDNAGNLVSRSAGIVPRRRRAVQRAEISGRPPAGEYPAHVAPVVRGDRLHDLSAGCR
jgi:YD repeat-containing protein